MELIVATDRYATIGARERAKEFVSTEEKEWQANESKKRAELWRQMRSKLGLSAHWSMFDEAGYNPYAVAVKGTNIVLVHTEHWGKKQHCEIGLPKDPTWKDLFIAADQLIRDSGDMHHCFIEGFKKVRSHYVLVTGS